MRASSIALVRAVSAADLLQGVGLGMKPPTYLAVGDVMEPGIDRLGTQRQRLIAAER
jgi:hypothetical protein